MDSVDLQAHYIVICLCVLVSFSHISDISSTTHEFFHFQLLEIVHDLCSIHVVHKKLETIEALKAEYA